MATFELLTAQGSNSFTAGTTYFNTPFAYLSRETVEANVQAIARSSYTWANLLMRVITNTATGSSTVRSRKNTANGAMSITIGAGLTGVFQDTTNSDSLLAGDLFNYQTTIGTGAGAPLKQTLLASTLAGSDTVVGNSAISSGGQSFADTGLQPIHGMTGRVTTEADAQYVIRESATFSNLYTYVVSNTIGASSTLRYRVGGANGNQVVTVGDSQTGAFEDTTNTDVATSGNAINERWLAGAGGSCVFGFMQMKMVALTGRTMVISAQLGADFSADTYLAVEGRIQAGDGSTTESDMQLTDRAAFTAKNLFVRVTAHGASNGVNIYLRQNGANSTLTVTIADSTTGNFEDTTNSVDIAVANLYNSFLDHGGGAGSISLITLGFEADAAVVATAVGVLIRKWRRF